jgi:hypothetical protein
MRGQLAPMRALKFPPFEELLDLVQTEIALWCKFAHVSAKRISVSLLFHFKEKPLGEMKGRTLPLGI